MAVNGVENRVSILGRRAAEEMRGRGIIVVRQMKGRRKPAVMMGVGTVRRRIKNVIERRLEIGNCGGRRRNGRGRRKRKEKERRRRTSIRIKRRTGKMIKTRKGEERRLRRGREIGKWIRIKRGPERRSGQTESHDEDYDRSRDDNDYEQV